MVLIGIVVNLCARQGVNRGRGQGNIGPVGPIGFAGLGSSLDLLFLPSLSTYTIKRKTSVSRSQKRMKGHSTKMHTWVIIAYYWNCSYEGTNLLCIGILPNANIRLLIRSDLPLEQRRRFQTTCQREPACQRSHKEAQGCLTKSSLSLINWLKRLKSP